ncbi:MAG: hypothetical protein ACM31C_10150 [Acidobacteriota bacterium]
MRALVILCMLASVAHADPAVLALDGKDIYVELGAKDGVGAGSELELLHEIVATDPVTKKPLRDHFALGTLTVVKAGDHVCVARGDDELAKRVLPGDHVRLVSAKRTFVDPWVERVAASQLSPPAAPVPGAPAIDHAQLARAAWQDTLGQPPEARITRWQQLLVADPTTPYAKAIHTEIESLDKQIAARDAALARARSAAPAAQSPRVADLVRQLDGGDALLLVAPIDHSVPDRPIELAFVARSPAELAHAWLYVRHAGEPGYRRIELQRDGDAYLRGTIDREVVRAPSVEWYVEVTTRGDHETAPAIGSQQAPEVIEVQPVITDPPPQPDRSHVDLHVDYVDWTGKLSAGYDHYYEAEADFTYRFLEPVYAVRLGFGTLSGVGGPKAYVKNDGCLDADGMYRCTAVTFSYVYMEIEHRLAKNVALMLRPQFGSLTTNAMQTSTNPCDQPDAEAQGCRFLTGFGLRGRLRLGEEAGTNLVLGAGFARGVGTLLEAAYHWLPNEQVPVQITVQVTDQPVIEDFGVRLIGDVGLRKLKWFYPSLRASYQARDIHHTGVSGGLAMNFDW